MSSSGGWNISPGWKGSSGCNSDLPSKRISENRRKQIEFLTFEYAVGAHLMRSKWSRLTSSKPDSYLYPMLSDFQPGVHGPAVAEGNQGGTILT
jgi:hypothetical protein